MKTMEQARQETTLEMLEDLKSLNLDKEEFEELQFEMFNLDSFKYWDLYNMYRMELDTIDTLISATEFEQYTYISSIEELLDYIYGDNAGTKCQFWYDYACQYFSTDDQDDLFESVATDEDFTKDYVNGGWYKLD